MNVFTDRVHLTAPTLEELHNFADKAGIKRCWFSDHKEHPHYDLPKSKIQRAIDNGAHMVSPRECLRIAKLARINEQNTFELVTEAISLEIGQEVYHGHIIFEHFGLYGNEHPYTAI